MVQILYRCFAQCQSSLWNLWGTFLVRLCRRKFVNFPFDFGTPFSHCPIIAKNINAIFSDSFLKKTYLVWLHRVSHTDSKVYLWFLPKFLLGNPEKTNSKVEYVDFHQCLESSDTSSWTWLQTLAFLLYRL